MITPLTPEDVRPEREFNRNSFWHFSFSNKNDTNYVNDGQHINEGDVIGENGHYDHNWHLLETRPYHSNLQGWISIIHDDSDIHRDGPFAYFFDSMHELIEKTYRPQYVAVNDAFTGEINIFFNSFCGEFGCYTLEDLLLSLEWRNDRPVLDIIYKTKTISLSIGDSISFLFDDSAVITTFFHSKPHSDQNKYPNRKVMTLDISPELLNAFNTKTWGKLRVTFKNGNTPIDIPNIAYRIDEEQDVHCKADADFSANLFMYCIRLFIKEMQANGLEWNDERKSSTGADDNEGSPCYVYLMEDTSNGFFKIGISSNPEYREGTLQSEKPTIELRCAHKYPSRAIAHAIEQALHQAFSSKRLRGEWFDLSPKDISDIKDTLS